MNAMARWQLKSLAKDQLRGHWGEMAFRTLVISVISLVFYGGILALDVAFLLAITGFLNGSLSIINIMDMELQAIPIVTLIMLVSMIVFLIFLSVLFCGYIEGFMKLREGQESSLNILFGKFNLTAKISGIYAFLVLLSIPFFVIVIRMLTIEERYAIVMLLLFYAAYFAYIYICLRLSMSLFILIENPDTKLWDAVKQSFAIMKGHCWRFFVLCFSFFGWLILSAFTLYIGLLWLYPYMTMTIINFYYDLKSLHYDAKSEVEFVN